MIRVAFKSSKFTNKLIQFCSGSTFCKNSDFVLSFCTLDTVSNSLCFLGAAARQSSILDDHNLWCQVLPLLSDGVLAHQQFVDCSQDVNSLHSLCCRGWGSSACLRLKKFSVSDVVTCHMLVRVTLILIVICFLPTF